MTINERLIKLQSLINEFQSIQSLYSESLTRKSETISELLEEQEDPDTESIVSALESACLDIINPALDDLLTKNSLPGGTQTSRSTTSTAIAMNEALDKIRYIKTQLPSLTDRAIGWFAGLIDTTVHSILPAKPHEVTICSEQPIEELETEASPDSAQQPKRRKRNRNRLRKPKINSSDQLSKQIQAVYNKLKEVEATFEKVKHEHELYQPVNLKEYGSIVAEDAIIKTFVKEMNLKTLEANDLVQSTVALLETCLTSEDYIPRTETLNAANEQISRLNHERYTIREQLLQRIELLKPVWDEELDIAKLQEIRHTKNRELIALTGTFLNNIAIIKFIDTSNSESATLFTELKDFLKIFFAAMNNSELLINNSQVKSIEKDLFKHLNCKDKTEHDLTDDKIEQFLGSLNLPLKKEPHEWIDYKTRALVNKESAEIWLAKQLRRHILAASNLATMIDQFICNKMKQTRNHEVLMATKHDLEANIQEKYSALITKASQIEQDLRRLKELCYGKTYPKGSTERAEYDKTNQLLNELDQFKISLNSTLTESSTAASGLYALTDQLQERLAMLNKKEYELSGGCSLVRINYDPTKYSFERLKNVLGNMNAVLLYSNEESSSVYYADLQTQVVRQLEPVRGYSREFQSLVTHFPQKTTKANLETVKLIQSLTTTSQMDLENACLNLASDLCSTYNHRRNKIINKLENQLAAAKTAHNAFMTGNTNQRADIFPATDKHVSDEETIIQTMSQNKFNLKPLKDLMTLRDLREQGLQLSAALSQKIDQSKQGILEGFQQRLGDMLVSNMAQLHGLPVHLHPLNPFRVALENTTLNATRRVNTVITTRDRLPETIPDELITWKNNLSQQIALANMAIRNRDEVRFNAKIIEDRLRNPSYLVSVQTIIPALQAELARIRNLRGVNDPRLTTLQNIMDDFVTINNNFINEDLNLINGNRDMQRDESDNHLSYHTQLVATVNRHLRNEDMEAISDGRRSRLAQWIRRHILRPLKELTTPANQRHMFFATKGATEAERNLIDLGNRIVNEELPRLVNPVSAGAA